MTMKIAEGKDLIERDSSWEDPTQSKLLLDFLSVGFALVLWYDKLLGRFVYVDDENCDSYLFLLMNIDNCQWSLHQDWASAQFWKLIEIVNARRKKMHCSMRSTLSDDDPTFAIRSFDVMNSKRPRIIKLELVSPGWIRAVMKTIFFCSIGTARRRGNETIQSLDHHSIWLSSVTVMRKHEFPAWDSHRISRRKISFGRIDDKRSRSSLRSVNVYG